MTSNFDARKSFYAALSKAQGQIEGATKDQTNPHFKSKYADLGAVWDACREALSSNGLAVIQMPDYDPETKCVTVETIITHADGFEKSSTLRVPTAKQDAQGVGSAITYGRRYALMAAVGIAPEDDDGNAAAEKNSNAPAQPTALPKGRSRELYSELQEDVRLADSVDALTAWFTKRKADVETLPDDWKQSLRGLYADKMTDLKFGTEKPHAAE